jgi:hypothetical protein
VLEFLNGFDFQTVLDTIFSFAFKIVKIPFRYWDMVPDWIKLSLLIVIFLIALVFAYITWKYKDEWRNRY